MKILKMLLVGLAAVIAFVVALGFMMPSTYRVERVARIDAAPARVYAMIEDPREWQRWSAWNRRDPQMKITYYGPARGEGAGWEWDSKSEGKGSMMFIKAEAERRIEYSLLFAGKGFTSRGAIALASDGRGTAVSWTNEGDVGRNPVFRLFVPFMDGMVGPDFAEGLANLKAMVEKNA